VSGGRNPRVKKEISTPPKPRPFPRVGPRFTPSSSVQESVGGAEECRMIAQTTYTCSLCGFSTLHKSSLQRHQTNAHGRVPMKPTGKRSPSKAVQEEGNGDAN